MQTPAARPAAAAAALLFLCACAAVGYFGDWQGVGGWGGGGLVHWTWSLTYLGIPAGCFLAGLVVRRAGWILACAAGGPAAWLAGFAAGAAGRTGGSRSPWPSSASPGRFSSGASFWPSWRS